jgi:hypothetical protein
MGDGFKRYAGFLSIEIKERNVNRQTGKRY